MRVGLVAAGGVGAGFGAYLHDAGHEVVALARGKHLEAIQADGLIVHRPADTYNIPVKASDNASELGTVDLVLFAVKMWDTRAAAQQMMPMVGPQTTVLVLQNGVDALDLLTTILGRDRLIGGVAHISAVIEAPGVVAHRSPFARIFAGEPSGGLSERVTGLVDVLSRTGIEAQASPQIAVDLWTKFVFIVGLSGATSLFRAPIGQIRENEQTAAFLRSLASEAVAVGRAEGIALPDDQVERTMAFFEGLPDGMTASMCEDLLAGRRLELPWLSGRVVRSGDAHGIPTPANAAVELGLLLHTAGAPSG